MIDDFLGGAISFGYCLSALYFFKFWLKGQDAFFLLFAIAFCLLGGSRLLEVSAFGLIENQLVIYLIRLFSFVLIIFAIVKKNRSTLT